MKEKSGMNTRICETLPEPVVRRLTKYLSYTARMTEEGVEWVSSADIGDALGLTGSTVRQDLAHISAGGVTHRGYNVERLHKMLRELLGADRGWCVVIVGAGNLGCALAQHGDFDRYSFKICGIFDNDPTVIGKKVGDLKVAPMSELGEAVRVNGVEMGILAVPCEAAQEVTDELVAAGIHGILNLAYAHVRVPEGVALVNARILERLQELACLLNAAEQVEGRA